MQSDRIICSLDLKGHKFKVQNAEIALTSCAQFTCYKLETRTFRKLIGEVVALCHNIQTDKQLVDCGRRQKGRKALDK